ncbi:hypothetical protein QA640_27050 [Bradyrhizobium sp. CB82]|nr:hypothetical protein [Bradyrhizobium sp. CB82]WFU38083.1 hypothetical protein QA640_27050 [Bradyrhizobium sp. CB82]
MVCQVLADDAGRIVNISTDITSIGYSGLFLYATAVVTENTEWMGNG